MGRIRNAFRRALGLNEKRSAFGMVKKPLKLLKVLFVGLFALVVIIVSMLNFGANEIFNFSVDWWQERGAYAVNAYGSLATGGSDGTGGGVTSVAVSGTSAPSPGYFEDIVSSGGTIDIPEERKRNMMLENIGFEDLVNGTYNPFGVEGDGDEKFKDITIKTERKLRVRIHPSESEITTYRTNTRTAMWDAKMAEYNAAVSAAATPEPTPEPTVTPAPPPTPKPSPSAGKKGGAESPKGETLARPAQQDVGVINADGTTGAPTKRPTKTPATKAPSPHVIGKVTGTGTPSPSATGTPSPTATPIPTPTWTEEDEKALEKAVSDWISDNSKEEDRNDYVETVISGEQLRKYMNSFHMPWQVNYCMAAYLEIYELNIGEHENTSISEEAAQMAFGYGNLLNYNLVLNYWDGTWDGREITLADKESVLGNCRIDTTADHTSEPVKIDDNTDILKEEGFYPIVLFKNISGWSVNTYYGDRLDTLNDFGYYNQAVIRTEMSKAFDGFFGYTDMGEEEILTFTSGLKAMPEPEKYRDALLVFEELFIPGNYVGGFIDLGAFTHLAAGSQGEQSVYNALLVVDAGAVYSQGNRYGKNSYDCSSLVNRIYKDLGIDLSWHGDTSTNGLAHYFVDNNLVVADHWDESVLQPGDVILWSKPSRTDHYLCVYHAGIYAGNGMIVDASSSRKHVVYREMWGMSEVSLIGRPSAGMADAGEHAEDFVTQWDG